MRFELKEKTLVLYFDGELNSYNADGIEKEIEENGGKYTGGDITGLQRQIERLNLEIHNAGVDITRKGALEDYLTQQALKERADLSVAANKAKIRNGELELRDSEASVTNRTAEQIQAQADENGKRQPTAADVVQEAVEEGKARAEKAEDETEKLADRGRDDALKMQSHMAQVADSAANAEIDEDIINHMKEFKKISIDDALER